MKKGENEEFSVEMIMCYEDLNIGMKLICNQSDGNKKELIAARKGIDGFGTESVVFQSVSSCAQFYCRAEDVPYWYIEPSPAA